MKFTFKTEKSKGKFASFTPITHYIKLKGKRVGIIVDEAPYFISIAVLKDDINDDGNPNRKWKWITLKKESNSILEAKEWLNEKCDILNTKYKLHPLD